MKAQMMVYICYSGDQGMVLENSRLGYRYEQRLLRLYNENRQTSSNDNKQ